LNINIIFIDCRQVKYRYSIIFRQSPSHPSLPKADPLVVLPCRITTVWLVFEVIQESDGGYCAECLTENIFTEADTWDQLRKNVLEATSAFFFRSSPA
jgi:hypothetical protein